MSILDMFALAGRRALVTGGGSGIGQAIAFGLADAGADVAVVDKNPAAAADTCEQIKAMDRRGLALAAAVTAHPTDGHPVAAEELGHRVGDDVGSVFDGSQQIRGGERRVDR